MESIKKKLLKKVKKKLLKEVSEMFEQLTEEKSEFDEVIVSFYVKGDLVSGHSITFQNERR